MSNVLHTLSPWSVSRSDSGWRLVRHGSSTGVTLPVTGSTLWVDATYGSDDTGTRNRFDRPYLTIGAAAAARQSGDLIHVRPGTYDERNLWPAAGTYLYQFDAGADVVYTGATDGGIFDDSNGAVTCVISGGGKFRHASTSSTNGTSQAATPHNAFKVSNASSTVTVRCRSITCTTTNSYASAVLHTNGTLYVETAEPIGGEGNAWGVWWEDGPLVVRAPECTGATAGGIGIHKTSSTAVNAYFFVNRLSAGGAGWSVQVAGGHDNARVWFICNEAAGYISLEQCTAGRFYLNAQKVAAQSVNISPIVLPLVASTAKTWLTIQKLSVGNATATFNVYNGGYLSLDVAHVEDVNTSAFGLVAPLVQVTVIGTGRTVVRIGDMPVPDSNRVGPAVSLAGNVILSGLIDTRDNVAMNPLDLTGSGVTLGPVVLRSDGSQPAVTAVGGPQGVVSVGSLAYDAAPSGDVTVTSLVAGGLSPAGSGSELQYRASATTLGALTGSSVSGSALTVVSGFVVRMSGGVAGQDEIQVGADSSNSWVYSGTGNQLLIGSGGTYQNSGAVFTGSGIDYYVSSSVRSALRTTRLSLDTAVVLDWGSGGGGGTADTGIVRIAAGVVELNNGTKAGAGKTLRSLPLTPSQITGNQNDYAPGVAMFYRLSTDSSRDITGLSVGQLSGQVCEIWNVGAQNIVLKHQDTNSTDVNRFLNVTGADITLAANEIAQLRYDATTQRWRVWEV